MHFPMRKTGCRVETVRLVSLDRIECALTLLMVVSWRIARLMRLIRLGRTCRDLLASLMFDPDEIKAGYVLTNKPLTPAPPSLNDRVRRVEMLCGSLARKSDGEPGLKTLWIGYNVSSTSPPECVSCVPQRIPGVVFNEMPLIG
jgi:hypothetical protein